jgi:hypothetical protein
MNTVADTHVTDPGPDRDRPWYCFKYFSETSTYDEFRSICCTLAVYGWLHTIIRVNIAVHPIVHVGHVTCVCTGDIQVIFDYLIGQCGVSGHRKQAVWLLNELTSACNSPGNTVSCMYSF